MAVARHHHYLSQCYLKGFSRNGGKKSKLTTIDLKKKMLFETIPRNVGGVRDFNRLDIEGVDPNLLEGILAGFEGKVAAELRNLEDGALFEGDTRDIILEFISLLAIRTPDKRAQLSEPLNRFGDMVLRSTVSSPEKFNALVNEYRKDTGDITNLSYEEMAGIIGRGELQVNVSRELMIEAELHGSEMIRDLLHQRRWSLIHAEEGSGNFITSDNPVCLMWADSHERTRHYSPGFGLMDTLVLFPVSKNLLLCGSWDEAEGKLPANQRNVAIFNTAIIRNSTERIFAPDVNFYYLDTPATVRQGKHLV